MPLTYTQLSSRAINNDEITITRNGNTIVINNRLDNTQKPQEDIIFYLNFHDEDKTFLDAFMTKIAESSAPHLNCMVDSRSAFYRKITLRFYDNQGLALKENLKFLHSLIPAKTKANEDSPQIVESKSDNTPGANVTPITDSDLSITFADMTGEDSGFWSLENGEVEHLLRGADPYVTYTINNRQPALEVTEGEGEFQGSIVIKEFDLDAVIDSLMQEIIAEKCEPKSVLPEAEDADHPANNSGDEEPYTPEQKVQNLVPAANDTNDTNDKAHHNLIDRLTGGGSIDSSSTVFIPGNPRAQLPLPPPTKSKPNAILLSSTGDSHRLFSASRSSQEDQKLQQSLRKLHNTFVALKKHAKELAEDERPEFKRKGENIKGMIAGLNASNITLAVFNNTGKIADKAASEWRALFTSKDNKETIQHHLIIIKPQLLTILVMCTIIGLIPLGIRLGMSLCSPEGYNANEVMICGHTKTQNLVDDVLLALDEVEKNAPVSLDEGDHNLDDIDNEQPFERTVGYP